MKRIRRAIIVLLAMGLIVSLTMVIPASAEQGKGDVEVINSEFVVCTMESTGEIEEVQVFNILQLNGDGTVEVRQESAFEDVGGFQGVKSFAKPKVEGDYIVWPKLNVDGAKNVIAATKLSEASVEEARMRIPLDVRFKYWFDGEPVTDLETITGKSGRFKMELTLTNTSKEKREITYEDPATGEKVTEMVDVYLPLVILPYDWYFDNSVFFNMECDPTGIIVPMPDFFNVGWSIPLFPPATEESHTIWVAADVKNFKLPPLTLSVNFVFPETNQSNPLDILGPAMVQLYEGMKKVNEGIGEPAKEDTLLYGITAVDGGLAKLAAGLPEAASSIKNKLIPGVSQMAAGIGSPTTKDTLLYATTAASQGLQGISAGIGAATTENTLLWALNRIAGGLKSISDAIGSSSTPNTLLYAVNAMIYGLDNPSGVPKPGLLQAAQGIYSATVAGGPIDTQINNIFGYCQALKTTYPQFNPPGPPYDPAVDNILVAAGTIQAYINNNLSPPDINKTAQAMIGGIGSPSTPGTLLYAATAVYGGLAGIAAGIGSAATPDTLLFAVDQVTKGLNSIKAGIGSAGTSDTLLYALAAMQNGLTQIKNGLSTGNANNPGVKEGLILLASGLDQAVAGLGSSGTPDTLLYGTGKIKGGLTELGGGTKQLEGGLEMIVSNLNMTEAELEAIHERGEEFDHFLGRADDAENEVRFVYQSKPVYNYTSGSSTSWIVAIVLSVLIALGLAAGGILLARRSSA